MPSKPEVMLREVMLRTDDLLNTRRGGILLDASQNRTE
jgi:hypothetical protein